MKQSKTLVFLVFIVFHFTRMLVNCVWSVAVKFMNGAMGKRTVMLLCDALYQADHHKIMDP